MSEKWIWNFLTSRREWRGKESRRRRQTMRNPKRGVWEEGKLWWEKKCGEEEKDSKGKPGLWFWVESFELFFNFGLLEESSWSCLHVDPFRGRFWSFYIVGPCGVLWLASLDQCRLASARWSCAYPCISFWILSSSSNHLMSWVAHLASITNF